MNRNFVRTVFAALTLVLLQGLAVTAFAEAGENTKPPLQIVHQTGLKVLIQVNYDSTMPNGVGKQVLAAKNLYDQYSALGMQARKDYEIAMVFRADGAQFLLADDAYDAKVKQAHPKGNPNKAILDALNQGGVKMYECAVAMRMKGYKPEELLPYSRVVVSGMGAIVDFEKSGYLPVTP